MEKHRRGRQGRKKWEREKNGEKTNHHEETIRTERLKKRKKEKAERLKKRKKEKERQRRMGDEGDVDRRAGREIK